MENDGYRLPKIYKDVQYAVEYLHQLQAMSDEDLLDEVFDAQRPDDWDGGFTTRGYAYALISEGYLRHLFLKRSIKESF